MLFDLIGHAVDERRVLLVLDNLERITVVGPELSTLLHRNPTLVLLGTSRIPLRVSPLLQALHPELPFLRDFLSAVDITSVVSLKR